MLNMVTDKLYMQVSLTLSTLVPNLRRTALKPAAPSSARSCVLPLKALEHPEGDVCTKPVCWEFL